MDIRPLRRLGGGLLRTVVAHVPKPVMFDAGLAISPTARQLRSVGGAMVEVSTKIRLSISLIALLASGCNTEEIYSKPGLTQVSLDQDHAYCELMAMNSPQQQTQVDVYTTHTTNYGNYSTTTVAPDPMLKLVQLLAMPSRMQTEK